MSIFKKHNHYNEPNETNEFSFRIKISNNKDSKEVILWHFMATHCFDELVHFVSGKNVEEYYYYDLVREYDKRLTDYELKIDDYESKIESLKEGNDRREELQKELSKLQEQHERTINEQKELYRLFHKESEAYHEIYEYPDLVKIIVQRESSFFVESFKKYIDNYLEKFYEDFLTEQGLTKKEFSRPRIKDMRLEDGSLLTLFNLIVTTATNLPEFGIRLVKKSTIEPTVQGKNP